MTDLNTAQRLTPQPVQGWASGAGPTGSTVVVDPTRRYQTMTGFGASMTDTSAWVLTNKLSDAARRQTMTELFSADHGIGLSMLRQPMGASDFAVNGSYSYDDMPAGQTDPNLAAFSIDHDKAYIIPRLRQALAINPKLTMMANPWSAPGWMKTSDSMITGSLKPEFYDAYARYFVKFLKGYRAAGLPTDFISVQNEPLYEPGDYPGMSVPASASAAFIGSNLGPAVAKSGMNTQILAYDHNWDVPAYPEEIYHDAAAARYVPGTAWHCYGGDVTAQTVSHNDYPHAQAFLTECSGGTWQGGTAAAFEQSMALAIGVPRNWGQSVVLWNLALDQRNGPTNGGCQTCRGVVTVNDDGTVTKEVEYYALGHASKFLRPGAVRIASSVPADAPVSNVAYQNRDGSQVLVAYNGTGTEQHFSVQVGTRHVSETLAAGAAATYRWTDPGRTAATGAGLGWIDLDLGRGPAGTPGGRLVQSVSAGLIGSLNSVRLGDRWLTYSKPFGAELRSAAVAQDLSRAGWTVAASSSDPASPVANMTDGDLSTRWSSGTGQGPGSWVGIDLGAAQEFNQVVMNSGTSPGDYVRTYQVETSPDGVTWTPIARGQGSTDEMVIPLPPTTTRHLRIASEASSGSWWSIHELNLRTSTAGPVPATPPGQKLVRASGTLSDGTQVTAVYNAGRNDAQVDLPLSGFGYAYWLPSTAAVTFAVQPVN
ncbi:discoidin domain-containing protein [Solirubrobacter ginsenosidimutans]|uniref:Discoidin domain-containing protein n=1 Tax=Solirubrobacter ginsenosidimutans TaxID=490573 RepID=A0A9X3S0W5_9ACTN|nr:discoidin domain-containing protein [Solirubrobacter ginsenosidimutans]MDA0160457.1 discoidin domain-containing protein [Solirubrobacter ginsenosidimutans]